MKIAIFTHYMPPHHGGIERVAESHFQAYRRAGLEVRWLASRVPSEAPTEEPDGRRRTATWNVLEDRLGVPVPIWSPAGWRKAARLVRWADVVHVHDCLYPGSVAAALFGRRRRTPVMLTQHVGFVDYGNALLNGVQRLAYGSLGKWVLRRTDRVVLATPAASLWVEELFGGPEAGPARLKIYNGIDLGRFRPPTPAEKRAERGRLGIPADLPVVLFVGRLVEKKGVPLLAAVIERVRGVHFVVVGDGPLADRLAAVEGAVTRVPAVAPEEMPSLYRAADCLLLPSHGEGLPLVVQEAMACGLPVVVSADEPYVLELAPQTPACVPAERRGEAMAVALEGLLEGDVERLGGAAAELAAARWGLEAMAQRYLEVAHELVEKGRG